MTTRHADISTRLTPPLATVSSDVVKRGDDSHLAKVHVVYTVRYKSNEVASIMVMEESRAELKLTTECQDQLYRISP